LKKLRRRSADREPVAAPGRRRDHEAARSRTSRSCCLCSSQGLDMLPPDQRPNSAGAPISANVTPKADTLLL